MWYLYIGITVAVMTVVYVIKFTDENDATGLLVGIAITALLAWPAVLLFEFTWVFVTFLQLVISKKED